MAGTDRTSADALTLFTRLEQAPYRFGYFQALRRLECLYGDKPRLGKAQRLAEDPVRLAQEPSMAFAPATLAAFAPGGESVPARLTVNFFGLLGPQGPLPLHLTEHARDRLRNESDPTFARFLDLFHHRMLEFYYRAWADAQPVVHGDRPDQDRFAHYLGALFGIGMPALRGRDAIPDRAKQFYAGLFAARTRSADGLSYLLGEYFGLPVAVEQFVGAWMNIPETHRWRLGESPETGSLGVTTTLGGRVWGCQQKFRIVFGPLSLADYRRMLPNGESLASLTALVRNYVGDELAWDLKLILKHGEVPPLTLDGGVAMGWTTWMGAGEGDRADLVLATVA